jgi:hypothetical protein
VTAPIAEAPAVAERPVRLIIVAAASVLFLASLGQTIVSTALPMSAISTGSTTSPG